MPRLTSSALTDFLQHHFEKYNHPDFIETDPISIPHAYQLKEDREIAGLITALLAWGQRPVILRNAQRFLDLMDRDPLSFILAHTSTDRKRFSGFVHRTFNGEDAIYLLKALQQAYLHHGGLEGLLQKHITTPAEFGQSISGFRNDLLSFKAPARFSKHLADPLRNSSAKRLCMYFRWMVRKDKAGVDFGIWKSISPSVLHCPLDLHSGRVARHLGLLTRNQDDWKAVTELTTALRKFDKNDPSKYDFALYGAGIANVL